MAASVCILKQEDFNMNALTHKEIIAWLRSNGQKLLDAADAIEGAFTQPEEMIRFKREVTPERIRERLRRGHSRIPQLAKEFSAPEETIRAIVQNRDNGIVTKDRGWLYLREDSNGG